MSQNVSSLIEQLPLVQDVQDVQDVSVHTAALAVNNVSLLGLGAKCRALLPAPLLQYLHPAYVTGLRRLPATRLSVTRAECRSSRRGSASRLVWRRDVAGCYRVRVTCCFASQRTRRARIHPILISFDLFIFQSGIVAYFIMRENLRRSPFSPLFTACC